MKMKKISKSRWGILALVVVGLIVLFNVAGCSVVQSSWDKINPNKIEVPVCEGEACEDIRG
jgi:hypothetical protein